MVSAANLNEPSVVVGARVRESFKKYIKDAQINLICNIEISCVKQLESGSMVISNEEFSEEFDAIINATSYQSLLPENQIFPMGMEVIYQPCIALRYQDKKPTEQPFSFIVMDGWFPCLMPYMEDCESEDKLINTYILTHGKWTIMGSFANPSKALEMQSTLSNSFIEQNIKPLCEQEMSRFWPEFSKRFEFLDWKSTVLAKLKTTSEFRSAVTFACEGVIYIIPGKISNIFDAEQEVLALLSKQNIIKRDHFYFMKNGVLDTSIREILDKPKVGDRSTCNLQTFEDLNNSETSF